MSNQASIPVSGPAESSPDGRLESWKEIAAYLRREVRTVQRWEKSAGLPVHRLQLGKQGPVYAYRAELDAWYHDRRPELEPDSAEQNASSIFDIRRLRPWAVAAAAVFIAMLPVGAYLARKNSFFRIHSVPPKIKLAVLPFANLSGDPNQNYFSAGLTDEMITRLGSLDPQHLSVIASASSNALAGKPIAEIGRALEVQYALEGSVRRDGNRVRIDVQLIQVSDQTHLWANSYDRDLNDILGVQDDVGTAVASQIRLALSPSSIKDSGTVTKRTVNPDAYEDYLLGSFYWNRGNLPKSIEAYQLAIQKDPQYGRAYAGLASGYALIGQVPDDDRAPVETKPRAREAAEHALQLDPQLAQAHAVLGNVAFNYDWNFERAEQEFQRALALGPTDFTYVWYAHYCIVRNRLPQALEANSRGFDLDPVSGHPLFDVVRAEIRYFMRNYDAAIEQGRRTVEQYSTYPLAYVWLGAAYREKKMYAEALKQFSKARQLSGDRPGMIALYGHALALSGDAAGARKTLAKLQDLAQSRYVSSMYFAAIYLGLGEKVAALDWLDRAYAERTDRLVYLGVDPIADPLRGDPRFEQLLHKIGVR